MLAEFLVSPPRPSPPLWGGMRGTPGLALVRPRKKTIMGDGMLAKFLAESKSQVNPIGGAVRQPSLVLWCHALAHPTGKGASQFLGSPFSGSNPQGWAREAVLPHAANAAPEPV